MATGNAFRLLISFATLAIVARVLGPNDFGAFATVVSVVGILGAFSGLGNDRLIVRRLARDPSSVRRALGAAFCSMAVSSPLTIMLSWIALPLLIRQNIPFSMIALVSIADLLFAQINVLAAACYQGLDRPLNTAWQNGMFALLRAGAAGVWLVLVKEHSGASWAWFYCVVSLVGAGISIVQLIRAFGYPEWNIEKSDFTDGVHFSLQTASQSVFREVDKPLIAALASLPDAGTYAAASRMADAALMPVRAFVYGTFRKFLELGSLGPRNILPFALKALAVCVVISLFVSLAIVILAQLVPVILGPEYINTKNLLYVLTAYPICYAFYVIAVDMLVGCDEIAWRTLVQILLPVIDVALCLVLIPHYGVAGGAVACVLAYGASAALAWIAVGYVLKKHSVTAARPF
jgi:O-antigen/teichoic acid export membrane protein